jgi:cytochrome c oxidase cbb3-type subunit 1
MSAISSSSPTASTGAAAATPAEIDASCRIPVLVLFASAAVWLVIASLLGMAATLKFHSPNLLADCAWLTYGRVHPASLNALIYGFGIQAGLGVLLWLICHLGRTRLALMPLVVAGAKAWNLGMTLGIIGILAGENTGYEWLEMPRYASVVLFAGYVAMAIGALFTLHWRAERKLYISQWFLLAALFWFPWIYSTANLLLVAKPVRGALQAAVDGWYINNLVTIWFGFIGLAAFFYFIPKILRRPLHSHYLGVFTFWGLAVFGSWGGVLLGTPLPSWMPALSTVAAVLTVIPVLFAAINVFGTARGAATDAADAVPLKFIKFGAGAFVVASLARVATSLDKATEILNFTWWLPALAQLALYGFFAMTMFGAMYYILARVGGVAMPSPKLISAHFWLAALGILIYVVPLAFGGFKQGEALNETGEPFLNVMRGTLTWLRVSTTGDLLMLGANLVFLLYIVGLLARIGKAVKTCILGGQTAEAAS